jgi:hypothetical protein
MIAVQLIYEFLVLECKTTVHFLLFRLMKGRRCMNNQKTQIIQNIAMYSTDYMWVLCLKAQDGFISHYYN